jgi:hypothetical protein
MGTKEMQDKFRIFSNGRGSYDIIKPKVQNLLATTSDAPHCRPRHHDLGGHGREEDLSASQA